LISVLIIVPYENIYPPMNGGMQRCFNIIHQLAKRTRLTLIIHQPKLEFMECLDEYPSLANAVVYSTKDADPAINIFNLAPARLRPALQYRWYKKTFKGPADGLFLSYYPLLLPLLKKQRYDVVVLENLASLNAVSVIRKYDRAVKIVYDAHNVDTDLAKVAVDKWDMKKETMQLINKVERSLYKTVDALIACSQRDLDIFSQMNDGKLQMAVIPNGVSVSNKLYDNGVQLDNPEYILFCGTLSSVPNTEGILWFYDNCWPIVKKSNPDLKLLVLGSGEAPKSMNAMINDASIEFSGTVDDVRSWYNKASVALVPLLSGSGTRLKILEAMSLGLPVVSTSKGAEGIEYTEGKNILIADKKNDFANKVMDLLNSKEERNSIQLYARKLVQEKYDWDVVGKSLSDFIHSSANEYK
jgi:polysaccharide biosynthesis protein PslH